MDRHRIAEETSRRLHAAVADRLRRDPEVLQRARERVRRWSLTGAVHPYYVEQWRELLDGPLDVLCELLTEQSERAGALRQASPFAGALAPRVRWQIWRETRREMSRAS